MAKPQTRWRKPQLFRLRRVRASKGGSPVELFAFLCQGRTQVHGKHTYITGCDKLAPVYSESAVFTYYAELFAWLCYSRIQDIEDLKQPTYLYTLRLRFKLGWGGALVRRFPASFSLPPNKTILFSPRSLRMHVWPAALCACDPPPKLKMGKTVLGQDIGIWKTQIYPNPSKDSTPFAPCASFKRFESLFHAGGWLSKLGGKLYIQFIYKLYLLYNIIQGNK